MTATRIRCGVAGTGSLGQHHAHLGVPLVVGLQPGQHEIDLLEVIQGLAARDLTTPVVVRFSDILRHRLKRLHEADAQSDHAG